MPAPSPVPAERPGEGALRRPLACVVANPSKPRLTAQVRQEVIAGLVEAGYRTPIWLETTPTETGATQALLAVASGASLVVAIGGDGTVRAVAAGLAGSGVPLGIVPLGTANLAARNLGIPRSVPAAITLAARGPAHPTDLAWVSTQPVEPPTASAPTGSWARPTLGSEHACLVVAGIGFDAELVASTRPSLKARMRWGAYALAALTALHSPRLEMILRLAPPSTSPSLMADGAAPDPADAHPDGGQAGRVPALTEKVTARCLLVANGGGLPAGITVLPGAAMDDGVLDVAAIDTVAGLAGWTSLARQLLPPMPAHYADSRFSLGRVVQRHCREVEISVEKPSLVEVDGELLAPTRHVRVRVDPGAVLIRRPS